jgi:hypothetical protein
MIENDIMKLEILATLQVQDTLLVTGKLISSDLYDRVKPITHFTCIETGGRWKLTAIPFKRLSEQIRAIGLEHVEGIKNLK